MKKIKPKHLSFFGAISTFFGGIGIAVVEFGLCPCVLAPALSLIGVTSLTIGFLADKGYIFLIMGVIFLITSIVIHRYKKTCKVHRKR